MAKRAPSSYGGVTGDDATGTADVYITADVDPTAAIAELSPYVQTARAQVAGFGPHPAYPDLHVQLVRSAMSYADYAVLYQRVSDERWTADTARRVVMMFTDYANQQVVIGVLDRTDHDIAAAATTFGRTVRVDDAGPSTGTDQPAVWTLAPSFSPTPESTTLELVVSERACAGGQSAAGRITPNVVYATASITVTITVRSLGGPQTCPGAPPTLYTLQLSEPLGDRTILGATPNP